MNAGVQLDEAAVYFLQFPVPVVNLHIGILKFSPDGLYDVLSPVQEADENKHYAEENGKAKEQCQCNAILPLMLFLICGLDFREEPGYLPRTEFAVEIQRINHTVVSSISESPLDVAFPEHQAGQVVEGRIIPCPAHDVGYGGADQPVFLFLRLVESAGVIICSLGIFARVLGTYIQHCPGVFAGVFHI